MPSKACSDAARAIARAKKKNHYKKGQQYANYTGSGLNGRTRSNRAVKQGGWGGKRLAMGCKKKAANQ